jgi:hypothetical protein
MVPPVPAVSVQEPVDDVLGVRELTVLGDNGGNFGTRHGRGAGGVGR